MPTRARVTPSTSATRRVQARPRLVIGIRTEGASGPDRRWRVGGQRADRQVVRGQDSVGVEELGAEARLGARQRVLQQPVAVDHGENPLGTPGGGGEGSGDEERRLLLLGEPLEADAGRGRRVTPRRGGREYLGHLRSDEGREVQVDLAEGADHGVLVDHLGPAGGVEDDVAHGQRAGIGPDEVLRGQRRGEGLVRLDGVLGQREQRVEAGEPFLELRLHRAGLPGELGPRLVADAAAPRVGTGEAGRRADEHQKHRERGRERHGTHRAPSVPRQGCFLHEV